MKVSDLLVACLEREGVEHVFGLPGEEMEDLLEWTEEESDDLAFDEDASSYDEDTKTWSIVMVQT